MSLTAGSHRPKVDDPVRWGKMTICPRCQQPVTVGRLGRDGNWYHLLCRTLED